MNLNRTWKAFNYKEDVASAYLYETTTSSKAVFTVRRFCIFSVRCSILTSHLPARGHYHWNFSPEPPKLGLIFWNFDFFFDFVGLPYLAHENIANVLSRSLVLRASIVRPNFTLPSLPFRDILAVKVGRRKLRQKLGRKTKSKKCKWPKKSVINQRDQFLARWWGPNGHIQSLQVGNSCNSLKLF